ncbi:MAG: HlyD family secretion protein, partial [Pseudomonadales bacterium]|nr:HlyD family secretion protein [Pseudomonadales bacterium]
AVIRQDVAGILASLSGHADLAITDYPEVQSAIIDLKQAELNLAHTEILAPFDGFVSNVPPIGKHLGQGSPVLTVVAGNDIWVEANFNETELADIRVNQPVVISVDAYPGRKWQGHISSLSPATGAEFSILPPQNATGNWIKVVQRVPVRIDMEQHSGDPVLRAGMSVHVSVDLHSSSS